MSGINFGPKIDDGIFSIRGNKYSLLPEFERFLKIAVEKTPLIEKYLESDKILPEQLQKLYLSIKGNYEQKLIIFQEAIKAFHTIISFYPAIKPESAKTIFNLLIKLKGSSFVQKALEIIKILKLSPPLTTNGDKPLPNQSIENKPTIVQLDPNSINQTENTFENKFKEILEEIWPKLKKFMKSDNCEQIAGYLARYVWKKMTGHSGILSLFIPKNGQQKISFKRTRFIKKAPMLTDATERLRGKKADKLKNEDFKGLPIGTVFFVNSMGPEIHRNLGTTNRIPVVKRNRHWFTLVGFDKKGSPLFLDNTCTKRPFRTLKHIKILCRNRIVCNVLYPYKYIPRDTAT